MRDRNSLENSNDAQSQVRNGIIPLAQSEGCVLNRDVEAEEVETFIDEDNLSLPPLYDETRLPDKVKQTTFFLEEEDDDPNGYAPKDYTDYCKYFSFVWRQINQFQ